MNTNHEATLASAGTDGAAPTRPIPQRPTKRQRPATIEIGDLLATVFPEPRWAVDTVIPEGGGLLAGRPKSGKSWLALHLALAVGAGETALGRIPVTRGSVFYLALEDGPRRLYNRIRKLGAVQAVPPNGITFATNCPRSSVGGLEAIDEWLDGHPDARMVVIDTLAKFRDRGASKGSVYDEDYAAMAAVQELAIGRGVAVLGVTHTRKPRGKADNEDEDPLDEVQNSTGITGAADAVLVLKRQRGAKAGTLFVTGRDLEERTLQVAMDPDSCRWTICDPNPDDPDACIGSEEWRKVRQAIRKAGRPLRPSISARALGKDSNAVSAILKRMKDAGVIYQPVYGEWDIPRDAPEARQSASDRQTAVSHGGTAG